MGGLVDCFSFLFLFHRICTVLSHSFTVLLVSLSFFLRYFRAKFLCPVSCLLFFYVLLGHVLLSFLQFCFFVFCAFDIIQCVCPASFLVAVEPFTVFHEFLTSSSDGYSCSCIVLASLQSCASLLLLVFLRLFGSWFLFRRLLQFRVVAPPLFSTLRQLCPLILHFVYSTPLFHMLRFRGLLPPRFSACCSLLSRFSACGFSGCFLIFCYGSVFFLVAGSPEAVPSVLFCASLRFCSFLLSERSQASFVFSLRLQFVLRWYTLLSFECRSYFLWCFCLVQISGSLRDVVSLWDESGFAAASLSLSLQGCFLWWCPFLSRSPFRSYASFGDGVVTLWVESCFRWFNVSF